MTPEPPLLVPMALRVCPPHGEVHTIPFPLSVLGTLWDICDEPGIFHFFPTPLVTFDLECRFLLLEEWLSLLPGCLGGLSSEPFEPFP